MRETTHRSASSWRPGTSTPLDPRQLLDALHLNENPYPPLASIVEVVRAWGSRINRYPAESPQDLVEALAARHGVTAAEVVTGPGSVAVAQQLVRAAAGPGDQIIFSRPTCRHAGAVVTVSFGPSCTLPASLSAHAGGPGWSGRGWSCSRRSGATRGGRTCASVAAQVTRSEEDAPAEEGSRAAARHAVRNAGLVAGGGSAAGSTNSGG